MDRWVIDVVWPLVIHSWLEMVKIEDDGGWCLPVELRIWRGMGKIVYMYVYP